MRSKLIIIILGLAFTQIYSCKARKKSISKKDTPTYHSENPPPKTNTLVSIAKSYINTPYLYGGNDSGGIDCSGLIHVIFNRHGINVPRTTQKLATTGKWIAINEVKVGDLVFFATRKNSRKINHVGLVSDIKNKVIYFIHSSTSKGVIESNLKQKYWYLAYVQARRVNP